MGRVRTERHSEAEQKIKNAKREKKKRKRRNIASWVKLPYPAMVKVLEHLTDNERVHTAQVCQSWKQAFQNPSLWRTRHFEFGGPKANASGRKALAFVGAKGSYLRKVFVSCRHITSNTCENITGTLEPFVACLREADLEEFHISGLELDRFWKYTHLKGKVADSLLELLRTKQNLKVLEVSLAQFGLLSGTELLQTVSHTCGKKLDTLLLDDFFHSRLAVFELGQFRMALQGFSNLAVVSLNYCCMYDDLVKHWAESLKGRLSTLRIKACDNEPHGHAISDSSWKALAKACPNLTLDLSIVGIGPASTVIPILAPHSPLASLHIWSGYDNDVPLQLNDTLNHIARNNSASLKRLNLDFDNFQDDIDDALVDVVTRCRGLKHLQLKAITSTRVANAICQLIRERQTVLTSVDIMLCSISDRGIEQLRDLREEMEFLAQERGISLILHSDLF